MHAAHEETNDAERAIRAGLRVLGAAARGGAAALGPNVHLPFVPRVLDLPLLLVPTPIS